MICRRRASPTNEFCVDHRPGGAKAMLFTFGADPRKRRAAAKPWSTKFKAKNIDPEGYVLYTYAAVQVWAQAAANKAKTTDPKKVAEAIHQGRNMGYGRSARFPTTRSGDITASTTCSHVWKNGKYSELQGGSWLEATRQSEKPAPTGRVFSADLPEHRKRLQQPHSSIWCDEAGEERDAGRAPAARPSPARHRRDGRESARGMPRTARPRTPR